MSVFKKTKFELECCINMFHVIKMKLENEQKEQLSIMAKEIINVWIVSILKKLHHLLCTLILSIRTGMFYQSQYLTVDFNGLKTHRCLLKTYNKDNKIDSSRKYYQFINKVINVTLTIIQVDEQLQNAEIQWIEADSQTLPRLSSQ